MDRSPASFFKLGSLFLFVIFLVTVNLEYAAWLTAATDEPVATDAPQAGAVHVAPGAGSGAKGLRGVDGPEATPWHIKNLAKMHPLIERHSNSPIPVDPKLLNTPVKLRQPFVILYTECTGTSLLMQGLNAHPHVATVGHAPLDVMVHQRFNVKDKYLLSSSQEALAKMVFSYPGPSADGAQMVQWRIQVEEEWPQVNDEEVPMKTAAEFMGVATVGFRILPRGIANPERFQNQLIRANISVIVVRRENVALQALCTYAKVDNATHVMAEGSGSIDLDPDRLRYFLATKSHQNKYLSEVLVPLKARLPTLELTYEMFENDAKGTYLKLFDFLGVSEYDVPWSKIEPYSKFQLTPKHGVCGFVHNFPSVCNSIHNRPKLDWSWDLLPCCHCCESEQPDPLVSKAGSDA